MNDYRRFPNRIANNAEPTFYFKKDLNEDLVLSLFEPIEYQYKGTVKKSQ